MGVLAFFPGVVVVCLTPPQPDGTLGVGSTVALGVSTVVFTFFYIVSWTQGCMGNVTTVSYHGDTDKMKWFPPVVGPGAVV